MTANFAKHNKNELPREKIKTKHKKIHASFFSALVNYVKLP
jgi:hypothetical protein